MNPKEELFLAKCKLYRLLLMKPSDLWTESEVNVGYELSKDLQIQELLERMKG
jgi:hypothetical protein